MKQCDKASNAVVTDEVALSMHLPANELVRFRTKLCGRKALYGECGLEDSCPFSHCLSWSRRNPLKHAYRPQLCPNVKFEQINGKMKVTSNCLRGRMCMYAHTKEEQMYHPVVYKTQLCNFFHQHKGCDKYFCPFAHGSEELCNPADIHFYPLQGPELLLENTVTCSSNSLRKSNFKGNGAMLKSGRISTGLTQYCRSYSLLNQLGIVHDTKMIASSNQKQCNPIHYSSIGDLKQQREVLSSIPSSLRNMQSNALLPEIKHSSFTSSSSKCRGDSVFEQNNCVCKDDCSDFDLPNKKFSFYLLNENEPMSMSQPECRANGFISETVGCMQLSKDQIIRNSAKLRCLEDYVNENENFFKVSKKEDQMANARGIEKTEKKLAKYLSNPFIERAIVSKSYAKDKLCENAGKLDLSTLKTVPQLPPRAIQRASHVSIKGSKANSSNCSTRVSRTGSTASLTSIDTGCVTPMENSPTSINKLQSVSLQSHSLSLSAFASGTTDSLKQGSCIMKANRRKQSCIEGKFNAMDCEDNGKYSILSRFSLLSSQNGLKGINKNTLARSLCDVKPTHAFASKSNSNDVLFSASNFCRSNYSKQTDNAKDNITVHSCLNKDYNHHDVFETHSLAETDALLRALAAIIKSYPAVDKMDTVLNSVSSSETENVMEAGKATIRDLFFNENAYNTRSNLLDSCKKYTEQPPCNHSVVSSACPISLISAVSLKLNTDQNNGIVAPNFMCYDTDSIPSTGDIISSLQEEKQGLPMAEIQGFSVVNILDTGNSKLLENSADGVAILKAWGRIS